MPVLGRLRQEDYEFQLPCDKRLAERRNSRCPSLGQRGFSSEEVMVNGENHRGSKWGKVMVGGSKWGCISDRYMLSLKEDINITLSKDQRTS